MWTTSSTRRAPIGSRVHRSGQRGDPRDRGRFARQSNPDHQVRDVPRLPEHPGARAGRPVPPHSRPSPARRVRHPASSSSGSSSTCSGTGPTSGSKAGPTRSVGSRPSAGTCSRWPRRRGGPRARGSRARGADRAAPTTDTTLGHRDLRPAVPVLHAAENRALICCAIGTACSDRAARRARGYEPEGRPLPVAHSHRSGGIGQLPGRHRPIPHQRRHRVRHPAVHQRAGRSRPDV